MPFHDDTVLRRWTELLPIPLDDETLLRRLGERERENAAEPIVENLIY